jgi:quercetin dioxygenase-like cupin family protein
MSTVTQRSFDKPDATMDMVDKITLDVVEMGGVKLVRATAEPGWRWSVHSKPVQKTDSCQIDHLLYVVSGRVTAKTNDGEEVVFAAGDVGHIVPGHDGWTVGDEPAVWIELPH